MLSGDIDEANLSDPFIRLMDEELLLNGFHERVFEAYRAGHSLDERWRNVRNALFALLLGDQPRPEGVTPQRLVAAIESTMAYQINKWRLAHCPGKAESAEEFQTELTRLYDWYEQEGDKAACEILLEAMRVVEKLVERLKPWPSSTAHYFLYGRNEKKPPKYCRFCSDPLRQRDHRERRKGTP